jgi:hypothetical protein
MDYGFVERRGFVDVEGDKGWARQRGGMGGGPFNLFSHRRGGLKDSIAELTRLFYQFVCNDQGFSVSAAGVRAWAKKTQPTLELAQCQSVAKCTEIATDRSPSTWAAQMLVLSGFTIPCARPCARCSNGNG